MQKISDKRLATPGERLASRTAQPRHRRSALRAAAFMPLMPLALSAACGAQPAADSGEPISATQEAVTSAIVVSPALDKRLRILGQLPTVVRSIENAAYFKDAFRDGVTQGPSMSLGVVLGDGLFFSQGFGQGPLGTEPTSNTPYHLASLSKVLTGAGVMKVLEQHPTVKLDDVVSKYYPPITGLIYPPDRRGLLLPPAACVAPCAAPMTIRHLLSHAAGFPHDIVGWGDTTAQLDAALPGKTLDYYPGYNRNYSNTGFAIAGRVIEMISGMTYENYMTQNIFAPLGMSNTFNDPTNRHVANGYTVVSDPPGSGHLDTNPGYGNSGFSPPYKFAPADQPFGGWISTVADLAKFLRMQLSTSDSSAATGTYPLSTTSLQTSQTEMLPDCTTNSALKPGTTCIPNTGPNDPYLPVLVPANSPTPHNGGVISAGWFHNTEAHLGADFGMRGGIPGYTSPMVVAPQVGLGLVMLLGAQPDSASGLLNGQNPEDEMWRLSLETIGDSAGAALGSWRNQPLPSGVAQLLQVMSGPALSTPLNQVLGLPHLGGMGLSKVSDLQAAFGTCSSFTVERIVSTTSAWVTLLCSKLNTSLEIAVGATGNHNITVLKSITTLTRPLGGEGLQDGLVLVGKALGNTIPVATSNGNGSFDVSNSTVTFGTDTAFALHVADGPTPVPGDFDGDGVGDIALTGVAGWNTMPVAFANGNGSFHGTNGGVSSGFTAFPLVAPTAGVHYIPGDFDGDGYSDIALSGALGWATIPVAFSNADGTFRATNSGVTTSDPGLGFATYAAGVGSAPGAIVSGDFDGDGRSDVAIGHYSTRLSFLPIALSNGDGTFHGWAANFGADTTFLAAMTQTGITAVTGDYNADGRSDIALIGNGRFLLALSQGNGTFVVPTCSLAGDPLPIGPLPVAGDFDGDQRSDIQLPGWGFLTITSSGTTCTVNEVHMQQNVTAGTSAFWSNSSLSGVTALSFR